MYDKETVKRIATGARYVGSRHMADLGALEALYEFADFLDPYIEWEDE